MRAGRPHRALDDQLGGPVVDDDRPRVGALGGADLGVGVVDVVAGAVGEHGVDEVGLDLGRHAAVGAEAAGVVAGLLVLEVPAHPPGLGPVAAAGEVLDVGVDQDRRRGDRVRLAARARGSRTRSRRREPCGGPRLRPYRRPRCELEVLARRHALDGAAALGRHVGLALDDRAHVDDPLALLARDLRPVVRVGGVGQVLVLLVLLVDRLDEVVDLDAPACRRPGAA